MKLGLSACKLRACFAALMICMLTSSSAVLSKEATAIPAAPLKAAMDAVILLPQISPQEKELIEALPDIIASVVAKQEGVASDIVAESECNFAQAAGLLQSLDEKLLSITQSADPIMVLHLNALRKTINLIVDVITLTQEPTMSDPTQVTRQTEALVDVVREKVNALMRQLLKMQSTIESISSSTTDIFTFLVSNFDFVESELEVIESKTDACCKVTQSKLDIIISDIEHLALSAFPSFATSFDLIESELEVIESKTDSCCKVTQSTSSFEMITLSLLCVSWQHASALLSITSSSLSICSKLESNAGKAEVARCSISEMITSSLL